MGGLCDCSGIAIRSLRCFLQALKLEKAAPEGVERRGRITVLIRVGCAPKGVKCTRMLDPLAQQVKLPTRRARPLKLLIGLGTLSYLSNRYLVSVSCVYINLI